MLYYPQISSGTISQYPVTRKNDRRTIVNTLEDGSTISMADASAAAVEWHLSYSNLTKDEVTSLSGLFQAAYGSWQTFTLLDPADNLLNWSEDVTQAPWTLDPLIQASGGVNDPLGGTNAQRITNSGQANQQISQTLPIPGWYQYCLSVWMRSDVAQPVWLAANAGQQMTSEVQAGPSWQRVRYSFQAETQVESLSAGIVLPPGGSVSIFGAQLEAQPGVGGYQKTRDRAGVYSSARFNQDTFSATATGVNQYSCVVKVICQTAG